jgi:6-methylsalicylate decarboxylase
VGGIYLGDAKYDPVFDEFNRRSAVIFIHPISPPCWEQPLFMLRNVGEGI